MNYKNLQQQDKEVYDIIKKEETRQKNELEMIASENYVTQAVMEAMGSILTNKYSEGYPGSRYYGGNQIIDEIEILAIERAKKLFHAEHVNVQPLSGSPANASVYMAFLKPGDKVLGLKLDHGGHLSHGHSVNFSGILYNFVQYEVDSKTGRINMEEVRKIAQKEKPKMIVAGYSAYSREIEWQKFQNIADEIGSYTFADIAHTAGLIAGEQMDNPVPIFDVVSTTTHKTLRGPRGAIIMCKEKHAKKIDKAVFPGMQGGPHDHITAAKAVAFGEALKPEFKEYAKKIIINSKTLAEEFINRGYRIISDGTDNHLIVVDMTSKNTSGKETEKILERIGISVSRSTIPNDPNPPMNPSGVRFGTPAITTRGLGEKEVKQVAGWIDAAITNKEDIGVLNSIKKEVEEMCKKFPVPGLL
ncbi:serine hydroxymethyltransferase [Candidatus Falkowbacteria bacterium RIFOXYB2_FULL_34_18]|uniref:Serine hydroxymethyltransferase n=1 Tax=Candidatus Falkowbacteria bacterium RIFOXYD2_FULL_34_120 TaxID=1798007 RepID=A0A1F5TPM2_9BACT|nr:MAG: serine hydroxymethyltransferase [Candidatus Falkowbacteria bacterium RIFOXYB2_FULL_34_18]OGF28772.1 MAG: serine hydroxymethyltransferase [Candidatus Falkowbacteria bacterium RIFOXYC12_FULL_34_55]OGF35701.1 MAG: serine hydroxymethyltransferase [Candidatus Falkowbacteria bacterium RIFOXYC2_FULL_34_220]OGF38416.1 MAG: serine hydroxymethyltransferase [Candidatus Falkowbacteria bacterium RIFOXYD12_FULL_34_57]OGF40471.1 MAG: serine hydroxymethyltransferase [Candidatus Falkowbacteria bacterium